MYLIEYKLGNAKIRKYILSTKQLETIILENPQYEYVKIIPEANNNVKRKIRKK